MEKTDTIRTGWTKAICRVCEILNQDQSLKTCKWCSLCKAFLCETCIKDWSRRAKAAWKELGFDV